MTAPLRLLVALALSLFAGVAVAEDDVASAPPVEPPRLRFV